MRYDKNGLPVKEYYTEELKTSPEDKMKAIRYHVCSSYMYEFSSELNFRRMNEKRNSDYFRYTQQHH